MTYYVKKDKCGITHLFNGELGFCDSKKHKDYALVKVGLHPQLTTCDYCTHCLSKHVTRDVDDVMREVDKEMKGKRKKK